VSNTTFSRHHIVPPGREMLSCTCLVPDGWVKVPVPDETYDFDNPTAFVPLLVCMAPYGAVLFTIAARPAFDDGTVQDWAEYLAAQNTLQVERVQEARVNRMPCVLIDATMSSEAGVMRSRSVFLEDGRRLYNVGTLAPDAIWPSVEADFDRLLGGFTLDEVHGTTAAPLRLMRSEPAIDLTERSAAQRKDSEPSSTVDHDVHVPRNAQPSAATGDVPSPNDPPTQAIDVALADDAASLDSDHPINARLRDNGVGLVPRVISRVPREKFASVGAGAIESIFRVPFGWHVIDDGKRTLVFDPDGKVQINLDLRPTPPDGPQGALMLIAEALASENPQAQFMKMELLDMPILAIRDLQIDGEQLDQAYVARASHREGLTLVCRVTADRDNFERAMNTAEVILTFLHGPLP
jgi:hypothetical protein